MRSRTVLALAVLAGCLETPNPQQEEVTQHDTVGNGIGVCQQIGNHGGHVIANAKIQNVFWGSYWTSGVGAAVRSSVDDAWRTIGNNRAFYTPMWQYGGRTGQYLGAAQNEGDPPPAVYDIDVQDMLQQMMWFGVIPMNDPDMLYVVYLPQGVVSHPDVDNGWGAHHDSFFHGGNGQPVYYATITPSNQINRLTLLASHEIYEAIADPGASTGQGWDEVADPCEDLSPRGFRFNGYLLERTYSDADCGCVTTIAQPLPSRHDIAWSNRTSGDVALWRLNGASAIESTPTLWSGVPLEWQVAGTGDFNGDGEGDLLWRNSSTGQVVTWLLQGATILGTPAMQAVGGSSIVGVGDFDGDGFSDVLWRNPTLKLFTVVFGGGRFGASTASFGVPLFSSVIAIGDFDGDRRSDILVQSMLNGQITELLMDGTVRAQVAAGTVGPEWQVLGTGDFNGDGTIDLLWRSNTGVIGQWFMSAGSPAYATLSLGTPSWLQFATTGDIDGDGKDDIVWRNALTGGINVWLISSSTIVGSGAPGGPVPTDRAIVGTTADQTF